jgi:hypothetical protein
VKDGQSVKKLGNLQRLGLNGLRRAIDRRVQLRPSKLVGGVAIIKVGAATETEMKEKKARQD